MADLSIAAANVVEGTVSGMTVFKATTIAGAAITAGQLVYKLASDGKLYPSDANASSTAANISGMALHGALTNQPLQFASAGPIQVGAILTAGSWYVASTNAGSVAPMADLASGAYSSLVGYGYSTSTLVLQVTTTGVSLA